MAKKIISYLIIFSLFWVDASIAMRRTASLDGEVGPRKPFLRLNRLSDDLPNPPAEVVLNKGSVPAVDGEEKEETPDDTESPKKTSESESRSSENAVSTRIETTDPESSNTTGSTPDSLSSGSGDSSPKKEKELESSDEFQAPVLAKQKSFFIASPAHKEQDVSPTDSPPKNSVGGIITPLQAQVNVKESLGDLAATPQQVITGLMAPPGSHDVQFKLEGHDSPPARSSDKEVKDVGDRKEEALKEKEDMVKGDAPKDLPDPRFVGSPDVRDDNEFPVQGSWKNIPSDKKFAMKQMAAVGGSGAMVEVVGRNPKSLNGDEEEVEEVPEVYSNSALQELPPETLQAIIERVDIHGDTYQIRFRVPPIKSDSKQQQEASENSPLIRDVEAPHPLKNFGPTLILKSENLTPELKKKLTSLHHQIIDEKWTGADVAGLIVGGIIGLGTTVAMMPVFNGGFGYLADEYDSLEFFYSILSGTINHATITPYVLLSTLFDAVPRNVGLWQKAFKAIEEKTVKWGRAIGTTFAVVAPSLLEPTYLILTELHNMKVTDTHGVNNGFAIWMFVLCPFLFADATGSNYEIAWEAHDDFKGWLHKSKSMFAGKIRDLFSCCLRKGPHSEEHILRKNFRKSLHTLNKTLLILPEGAIGQIYGTVFKSDATLRDQLQNQPAEDQLNEEEFHQAQGFFTLRYLLALGKKAPVIVDEDKSTWGSKLRAGLLVTGSPARLMALEFVLEVLLGLFLPKAVAKGCSWGLGVIAFPIQTALEYKGMKNFGEMWGESEEGHNSHLGARRAMKGISFFQGVIFTLPLLVLSLQVSNEFFGNPYAIFAFLPFILAETATQITSFNDRYNKKVTTKLTDVQNLKTRKCRHLPPRADYQRDRLMRKVQEYKEHLENIPPQILFELNRLLSFEEGKVGNGSNSIVTVHEGTN